MIIIPTRSFTSIRSLLHFDFPYYAETGDGLRDETASFNWTRSGSPKLAGSHPPAEARVADTPKFGYRCLQTASDSDYISASGDWSPFQKGSYTCQFDFWIRPTAAQAGNILVLLDGSTETFSLKFTSSRTLSVSCPSAGVSATSSAALTLNSWSYIQIQITQSAVRVVLNNSNIIDQSVTVAGFAANVCRLGGFCGQLDEFACRSSLTSGVPSAPTQGILSLSSAGGFGSGRLGDVSITSNCLINTSGIITSLMTSQYPFYMLGSAVTGKFGGFAAGEEVMMLNMETGAYGFTTVSSVTNSTALKFASLPVTPAVNKTLVIQIPHFNTLFIASNVVINPNRNARGIVAFRCKGNCTINGKIITSGFGTKRTDSLQLTHAGLLSNFLCGEGGGIFITCGGTFTALSVTRLGASWSGEGTGGVGAKNSKGGNGGAGYGGAGGGTADGPRVSDGTGGAGGVGGGGGAGDGREGGSAGYYSNDTRTTGGYGIDLSDSRVRPGGTQGINGGNGEGKDSDSGGGGAGGSGGDYSYVNLRGGYSGANIILIANTLKADAAAISTGGEGGQISGTNSGDNATGGGGTGFCYIACSNIH